MPDRTRTAIRRARSRGDVTKRVVANHKMPRGSAAPSVPQQVQGIESRNGYRNTGHVVNSSRLLCCMSAQALYSSTVIPAATLITAQPWQWDESHSSTTNKLKSLSGLLLKFCLACDRSVLLFQSSCRLTVAAQAECEAPTAICHDSRDRNSKALWAHHPGCRAKLVNLNVASASPCKSS